MIIIGLTGSIGMGKSTVSAMCRRLRIPVNNADDVVHRLLQPSGKGFAPVVKQFPHAVKDGAIDRAVLGKLVFGDSARLAVLESILHPLVAQERGRFLATAARRDTRMVVLDIPLLFERGLQGQVDTIVTVSAPEFLQRARVLARPGMNLEKYRQILVRQMSDGEKRRRSDFVIRTGGSKAATLKQLRAVLKKIDSSHARNRPRYRNNRA